MTATWMWAGRRMLVRNKIMPDYPLCPLETNHQIWEDESAGYPQYLVYRRHINANPRVVNHLHKRANTQPMVKDEGGAQEMAHHLHYRECQTFSRTLPQCSQSRCSFDMAVF